MTRLGWLCAICRLALTDQAEAFPVSAGALLIATGRGLHQRQTGLANQCNTLILHHPEGGSWARGKTWSLHPGFAVEF